MCGDSGQRHVREQRLAHLLEETGVVQVWRTCPKRPGSSKSGALAKETGVVHVGALDRVGSRRPPLAHQSNACLIEKTTRVTPKGRILGDAGAAPRTRGFMASCLAAILKAVVRLQKSQESGHQVERAEAWRNPYDPRRTGPDASAPPHFEVGVGTQVQGSAAESPGTTGAFLLRSRSRPERLRPKHRPRWHLRRIEEKKHVRVPGARHPCRRDHGVDRRWPRAMGFIWSRDAECAETTGAQEGQRPVGHRGQLRHGRARPRAKTTPSSTSAIR